MKPTHVEPDLVVLIAMRPPHDAGVALGLRTQIGVRELPLDVHRVRIEHVSGRSARHPMHPELGKVGHIVHVRETESHRSKYVLDVGPQPM